MKIRADSCNSCGRAISNPESLKRGMGHVCYAKIKKIYENQNSLFMNSYLKGMLRNFKVVHYEEEFREKYSRTSMEFMVSVLKHEDSTVFILTELLKNTGKSVTNCVEKLSGYVIKKYKPKGKVYIVEHYEDTNNFDLVKVRKKGEDYFSPEWRKMERKIFIDLLKKPTLFGESIIEV